MLLNGLLQFSPVDLSTARISLLQSVQILQLDVHVFLNFLVRPTSLPSCLTIFIGYHFARIPRKVLSVFIGQAARYLRDLIRSTTSRRPQRSLSWHDIFVPR